MADEPKPVEPQPAGTKGQHASIVEIALDAEDGVTNFSAMVRGLFRDVRKGTFRQRNEAAKILMPLLAPHASKIIDLEEAARAAGKTREGTAWSPTVTYVELPPGAVPDALPDAKDDDEDGER